MPFHTDTFHWPWPLLLLRLYIRPKNNRISPTENEKKIMIKFNLQLPQVQTRYRMCIFQQFSNVPIQIGYSVLTTFRQVAAFLGQGSSLVCTVALGNLDRVGSTGSDYATHNRTIHNLLATFPAALPRKRGTSLGEWGLKVRYVWVDCKVEWTYSLLRSIVGLSLYRKCSLREAAKLQSQTKQVGRSNNGRAIGWKWVGNF